MRIIILQFFTIMTILVTCSSHFGVWYRHWNNFSYPSITFTAVTAFQINVNNDRTRIFKNHHDRRQSHTSQGHSSLQSSSPPLWQRRNWNKVSSSVIAASRTKDPEVSSSLPSAVSTTDFVSDRRLVYIEDTDAYGIVYNSNYIKFYERALSSSMVITQDHNQQQQQQCKNNMIVSWKNQKFRSSPKLGDEYVIPGELHY